MAAPANAGLTAGVAAERVEAATRLLGRPGAERLHEAALEPPALTCLDRLGRFRVQRRCDARRAAPVGEARDDDRPAELLAPDLERVADAHLLRRLYALPVDVDMPAGDGVACRASGLEEARRPEPLVDPHLFHGAIFASVDELTELTSALVAIDSVNPALVPGGNGERDIALFVAEWCERQGLELEVVGDERPSVIATRRGSAGGRSLMLNAHLDTVGVAGMTTTHAPRVENGRLYGRGAYDMKGALAVILLVAAGAGDLRGDVVVTAVADEELASIGTEAVLERVTADAALVPEPTELQLAVAHRGFVGFELETRGVAAHGSRPDLGVDAIVKMGHVLVALEQLGERLQSGPRHPLAGTGSVHASLIEGGQELSSFPARCLLTGERRTIPGETVADVERELHALAGDAMVRVIASRDPYEAAVDHPFVELVARVAGTPDLVGAPFWTDAALIAGAGIPTVLYGPAGEGAHAEVEWVDLASLERLHAVIAGVASEWCA